MAYEYATYEKKGRIAVVTVNRPERMNALHPPANFELDAIWNDFERDPEVWVGILTGTGDKAFSAGNDLRFTAEHGRDMIRMADSGFGGLTNRTQCWKPIIAAVNGYALGGGFEMALACDIIIAADHARLGLPEPRVGLMAGAGGVHRLPRMIPQKIAMGYILTGRHMTAQEAHRLGVVNEVVPARPAHDHRARLGGGDPGVRPAVDPREQAGRHDGVGPAPRRRPQARLHRGRAHAALRDTVEGPRAFAEKRKPNWKAR
jgi:enoyl-CoA hydratase/carnithine racemase